MNNFYEQTNHSPFKRCEIADVQYWKMKQVSLIHQRTEFELKPRKCSNFIELLRKQHYVSCVVSIITKLHILQNYLLMLWNKLTFLLQLKNCTFQKLNDWFTVNPSIPLILKFHNLRIWNPRKKNMNQMMASFELILSIVNATSRNQWFKL